MSRPFAVVPLTNAHVPACCSLEARAFNLLRQSWGQASQPERRQDCLAFTIGLFPEGSVAALADGRVVGFCISHAWGSLGWIGPIAVDPDWQRQGIGRELTRAVVQALEERRSLTIALETWPHHSPNVHLYLRAGFAPGPLTVVLEKIVSGEAARFTGGLFCESSDRIECLQPIARLADLLHPGLDYTAPIRTTLECGLGEVLLWGPAADPEAVALLHLASQHATPAPDWGDVQLLMARPGSESSLGDWLRQLESWAERSGRKALRISVCSSHREALERLVRREGYRVVKLRLRMYHREHAIAPGCVNFISYAI